MAVERTKEYAETPREAPPIVESHRPAPVWPSLGHVKFDQYSTRYREGLDLVLRNISAEIPGGTKVLKDLYVLLMTVCIGWYSGSHWCRKVIAHPGSVPDH